MPATDHVSYDALIAQRIVGNALQHFDGDRYAQIAWVIMPNHVHLVFVQRQEWPLEILLKSWKRFTARQINQLLGTLWQFVASRLFRSPGA